MRYAPTRRMRKRETERDARAENGKLCNIITSKKIHTNSATTTRLLKPYIILLYVIINGNLFIE
jgi:hypothetical protein